MNIEHIPVMAREVVEMLCPKQEGVYVDATVGLGGHAEEILRSAGGCTLIGIDRDAEALRIAKERLKDFNNVFLIHGDFSTMGKAVSGMGYDSVSGILLDAGVSTLHLKAEDRGFSFLTDARLDMRMDQTQDLTAEVVVNTYPERELAEIIWKYGEDRWSRKIAKAIVYARGRKPIHSCRELAALIEKTVGRKGRIHPATRTFQAIRIEVNRELDELSTAVESGAGLLCPGGRFCVLSYHSLEDRIIKHAFRKLAKEGLFRIITKKPLVPSRQEQERNPSSRSAKLRVGERI